MAVHICRVFAVQSSHLFAAIREVNHNTWCGVERCRDHVDSAWVEWGGGGRQGTCIPFIMHQSGKVSRERYPRVRGKYLSRIYTIVTKRRLRA